MKTESADVSLGTLTQAFFLERLIAQRNASRQTVAAYRDSFRLLLHFADRHLGKAPERLVLTDVDAPLVLAFLDHLERDRGNSIRSRNARLAAIRSFVHFAAYGKSLTTNSMFSCPASRYRFTMRWNSGTSTEQNPHS